MLKDKTLTYISLFSSAGVGCYGFKMEGYHCIATNEIIDRRLAVQRCNHKCDLESGYIAGDITKPETKDLIYAEIETWRKKGNDRVDDRFIDGLQGKTVLLRDVLQSIR